MRVDTEDFIAHGLFGDVRIWMPWSELHAKLPTLPRYEAAHDDRITFATEGAVEITLRDDKVSSIKLKLEHADPPLPEGIALTGPTRIPERALKRLLNNRRVPWILYKPLSDRWGNYYWTEVGVHLNCDDTRHLTGICFDGGQMRLDQLNDT